MKDKSMLSTRYAAYLTAAVFGVLAGLGGFTHAIGEMLQGNVTPAGIVFNSWVQGPIAAHMGGEPAMTILPNLLITGLLNLIVSLSVVVWSGAFVQCQHGGRILVLLSVLMLLFGGGFGPPIIGLLAGVAGLSIRASQPAWLTALPLNFRRFLAALWPWVFAVTVLNGVFLVIGSVLLVYFFGMDNPDLFTNSFYFAVLSLLLTLLTGWAFDRQNTERMVLV